MGLFNKLEKGLSKGAEVLGDTLNKVGEASEGWGERADIWLAKDDKFENVKEKVAPTVSAVKEKTGYFVERAEETVTKVVADVKEKAAASKKREEDVDYINNEDVVAPEKATVFVEETVPADATTGVSVPLPETAEVQNALVEKEEKL